MHGFVFFAVIVIFAMVIFVEDEDEENSLLTPPNKYYVRYSDGQCSPAVDYDTAKEYKRFFGGEITCKDVEHEQQ